MLMTAAVCVSAYAVSSAEPKRASQSKLVKAVPPSNDHLGYLEYLPPNYSSTKELYPCIIFLHGSGEVGNGREPAIWKVAANGPFKHIIQNNHRMTFTVHGKKESFVVIGPQCGSGAGFSPKDFKNLYNVITKNYRVDPERIYVTGISMGGESSYRWAGSSENSPNLIAALGIMSATTDAATAKSVASKNIPIWAHHGDKDASAPWHHYEKAVKTMEFLNSHNPIPAPVFTVYPDVGHSAWNQGYSTDDSFHSPNLYEWFLSCRLGFVVDVGPEQNIILPQKSITINSRVVSANPVSKYLWTKQSGLAATLVNAETSTLTVNRLVKGKYVFRLTATDSKGNSSYRDVTVNVLPK